MANWRLEPLGDNLFQVDDEVWVRLPGGIASNSLIVGAKDGLVMIDTGISPAGALRVQNRLHALTGRKVRWVINTHYHGDHVLGNDAFADGASFICSARTRDLLDERRSVEIRTFRERFPEVRDELENAKVPAGTVAYQGQLELNLGGPAIVLRDMGHNHSPSDSIVILPELDLIFTADIFFNGIHPVVRDARLAGWRTTLEQRDQWTRARILPGHGRPAGPEDLAAFAQYMQRAEEWAREAVQEGRDAAWVAERITGSYPDHLAPERVAALSEWALREVADARQTDHSE